jgi:hypothetical protein
VGSLSMPVPGYPCRVLSLVKSRSLSLSKTRALSLSKGRSLGACRRDPAKTRSPTCLMAGV